MVRDTLVDICFRSGISAGLDVYVDLTGSSPLTQTWMTDFAPGRVVTDAAHRKRGELEMDVVTLLRRIRNVDPYFSSALVMKRVSKTIGLLDAVAKINDPQCELLLIRACAGISKLYFAMRTCPPRVFESAQLSFDMALRSALEHIVTASGPGLSFFDMFILFLMVLLLMTLCMALCKSQREDHTSDWLRVVPIPRLGQNMNACSKVFTCDLYGDHAISSAGVIGIKHRHNAVRDALVDIWWDLGLDVCVDLTGSSPLTQTEMACFALGRAVINATKRKRVKYEAKCADIGYGFLPFSFSSFGELEKDAMTLLKRIRKFSMAQDIGARTAIQIFKRISFFIAKGVGAQIVSRLPSNLL
ncbi:hypothetical protein Tco_1032969 [Tanacetum coccineum]|uniref:Uncharacterized protein n=1 Tax=Tanacetum coccineum TaxID=301880 RepID=A0ABQ5GEC6_9ASTR